MTGKPLRIVGKAAGQRILGQGPGPLLCGGRGRDHRHGHGRADYKVLRSSQSG